MLPDGALCCQRADIDAHTERNVDLTRHVCALAYFEKSIIVT